MNFLEQASQAVFSGDLFRGLEFYELSLKNDNLSYHDRLNSLYEIKNLAQSLDLQDDKHFVELLATHFEELERIEEAILYYSKLSLLEPSESVYRKICQFALTIGQIDTGINYYTQLLEHLYKKRSFTRILAFVSDPSFSQLNQLIEKKLWQLKVFVSTGSIHDVEKMVEEDAGRDKDLCSFFMELTSHNTSYWYSSEAIALWCLKHMAKHLERNKYSRKTLIKLLIDNLPTIFNDYDVLLDSLKIAKTWDINTYGFEVAKVLEDTELEDFFMINIPKELMLDQSFDLGADLLNSEGSKKELLKKNAAFSMSVGDREGAIEQITRIDDSNERFELLKKLKEDIRRQRIKVPSEKHDDNDHDERYFKVTVDYFDDDYIIRHYEDLICSMNMMKLFSVSLYIIERLHRLDISDKDRVNSDYLQIEILMKTEDYFRARDLAEDVLCTRVLSREERAAFNYFRAESSYYLGKKDQALKIFLKIKKSTPNYRLTEQWIDKIEKI